MKPYYADDWVTIYHGDCREILTCRDLHEIKATVVTDPPYPNNAGHFDDAVEAAREWLPNVDCEAIVFWSELEHPPVPISLVAVHVWHRANVNGRPYESAYQFDPLGRKRRSDVLRHAAIFDGAGPGCLEYLGHPTQKPVEVFTIPIRNSSPRGGIVLDPFAGSGPAVIACETLERRARLMEIDPGYCDVIVQRWQDFTGRKAEHHPAEV